MPYVICLKMQSLFSIDFKVVFTRSGKPIGAQPLLSAVWLMFPLSSSSFVLIDGGLFSAFQIMQSLMRKVHPTDYSCCFQSPCRLGSHLAVPGPYCLWQFLWNCGENVPARLSILCGQYRQILVYYYGVLAWVSQLHSYGLHLCLSSLWKCGACVRACVCAHKACCCCCFLVMLPL